MAKEISAQVDEATYAALAEQAEAAGLSVPELAGQVLAHDARGRRFEAAVQRFAQEWGPAFAEAFGPDRSGGAAA